MCSMLLLVSGGMFRRNFTSKVLKLEYFECLLFRVWLNEFRPMLFRLSSRSVIDSHCLLRQFMNIVRDEGMKVL